MVWFLMTWLCAANGECRPIEAPFQSRGLCIRAERQLKREDTRFATIHCHRRKAADVAGPRV